MVRVRAADVLRKVNFDKCLTIDSNRGNVNLTNQFSLDNKKRFSLRGLCDNKKNKSIFRDLSETLEDIEEGKLNEEGPLLTSKLEGTVTSNILRRNNSGEMERALDQVGGGRKRKYIHHDKKCGKIVKLCDEISREKSKSTKKTKKRGRKKKKATHHKKTSTTKKRRKKSRKSSSNKRSGRKKGSGKKGKGKRHFKKHNIFSSK
jgi:hypothetical protein